MTNCLLALQEVSQKEKLKLRERSMEVMRDPPSKVVLTAHQGKRCEINSFGIITLTPIVEALSKAPFEPVLLIYTLSYKTAFSLVQNIMQSVSILGMQFALDDTKVMLLPNPTHMPRSLYYRALM